MRGITGTSMQGVEYAPKRGNVKCCECANLIYKPKANKKKIVPQHFCTVKKQPRWYTAQCYCKQYKEEL